MKKLLVLMLSLVMVVTFFACGKKSDSNLYGKWEIDCIEHEGSKFSVEEWNHMEDEDLSGFYIVIKEGGKAYISDDGDGELVDWLSSEDSIMINGEKGSVSDGKICIDYYGNKIYLKKTDGSQEIPKKVEKTKFDNNDLNSDVDSNPEVEDAEIEEFLSEYEEWVDEYIDIITKYKENPNDTAILSEYTEMLSQVGDWIERVDEITSKINSADSLAKYAAEISRISTKLDEASK